MNNQSYFSRLRQRFSLRHSIRRRIMVIFIGLMASMLLAVWAINNFWLERYYVSQKQEVMEQAYLDINCVVMEQVQAGKSVSDIITEEQHQEWENWVEDRKQSGSRGNDSESLPKASPESRRKTLLGTIRTYGDHNNITTVLIDSYTGTILLRSDWETDFLARKVQQYVLGMDADRSKVLKQGENYVIEMNYDSRTNATYVESWGYFSDNKTLFIMSMPLDSIRESVGLSNRFITYAGLIVLVAGSVLMYFATNQVTRPILKLASLSEQMSELNFDVSCDDSRLDEIGVLGRSMNTLSDKLKETIGALQEANQQLQHDIDEKIQIDEMRKEFIANVSHELKTPLTSISGFAEIMQDGFVKDEDVKVFAGRIYKEAQRLIRLVGDVIRISRLDEGGLPYQWEELDLYSMVHDIFSTLHEAARKQEVHMYMEGGSTMLDTVPTIMEEVLYNVCDNAIKYNHRGGEVFVQLKDEGDVVRINVRDTGIGIPKEDQERIFERFYRVDKSHSKEIGGTGLGLSIVKHGVKTLNGRLWLNSEPGQGTEIIMEFPKHHMEKEAAE